MRRDPRFAELDHELIAAGEPVHAPAVVQARRHQCGVEEYLGRRKRRAMESRLRRAKYLRECGRFEELRNEGLA